MKIDNILSGLIFGTVFFIVCNSYSEEVITDMALVIFPENTQILELTLLDATRLAMLNNFDIQLAKFDSRVSRTRQGVAESIYDTILRAEAGYRDDQQAQASTFSGTKSNNRSYDFGVSKIFFSGTQVDLDVLNDRDANDSAFSASPVTYESTGKINVTQSLGRNFFGHVDRSTVKLAILGIQQVEYTSLEKIQSSLGDVQNAYWQLSMAQQALKVENEMLEQAQNLWTFNQQRIVNQRIEQAELLDSEANYRQQWSSWIMAKENLSKAQNQLKLLLNLTDDQLWIKPVDEFTLPDSQEDMNESLELAFRYRQDYHRKKNELEIRKIELAMQKNLLWPEIDLQASFARNGLGDYFRQAQKNIVQQDNPEFYVGLRISIPLENTKARSELEDARLKDARSMIELKYLERKIAVGIVDQVRRCNVLHQVADQARQTALLQEQKLEDEEIRFRQGRSSTDLIVRFQQDVTMARKSALEAIQNYIDARIHLRQQEGTLLQMYWNEEL